MRNLVTSLLVAVSLPGAALAMRAAQGPVSPIAQHPQPFERASSAQMIAGIQKTCGDIFAQDRNLNPDASFGRSNTEPFVEHGEVGPWQKFASLADLKSAVYSGSVSDQGWVWDENAKIVHAGFYYPAEDWETVEDYCFRADGSTSEIRSDVQDESIHQVDEREWVFDSKGRLIKFGERFFDEFTEKPVERNGDFVDVDTAIYLRVADLPFFSLLPKRPAR
jgi:hypothetical protein